MLGAIFTDYALMHQKNMRSTTDVYNKSARCHERQGWGGLTRMDSHGEDELIKLSVVICEMILPYVFDIARIAVRISTRDDNVEKPTHTQPWLFALFLMNIIGGRSSIYQLPFVNIVRLVVDFYCTFREFRQGLSLHP